MSRVVVITGGGTGIGAACARLMAAAGDAGVDRAVEIFKADIIRTLKLLGNPCIRDLDTSYVALRPGFRVD